MKKVLLICALALGFSAASFAQGPPRRTPDESVAQLKTQITGITDAQAAKLKLVYEAQGKKRDSLMAKANGDIQSIMPEFQKMRETNAAQIKAVLTPEQVTAFDKIPQRGPGGGGPR
jgi:periplasmic protein CpxP/Spy